jgi:hypothetical protein
VAQGLIGEVANLAAWYRQFHTSYAYMVGAALACARGARHF